MKTVKITAAFPDMPRVEALAKEAFPPEEYLAPEKLIRMAAAGTVDFRALYENDAFIGFTVISLYGNICYLFFLAIAPEARSKGYGSKVLKLLDTLYADRQQVVDFEMINEAAPNNAQRISRKAFYMRNGYKETGKFISYLGVDYEILCKQADFDFDKFKKMMQTFRIEGFAPKYFEKNGDIK